MLNEEQQAKVTALEAELGGNYKLGVIAQKKDGEDKFHATMHPANVINDKTATIKSLETKISEIESLKNEEITNLKAQLQGAEGKTQDAINLALKESEDIFKAKETELTEKHSKDLIDFKKKTALDNEFFKNGFKDDEVRSDLVGKFDLSKIELDESDKLKDITVIDLVKEKYKKLAVETFIEGTEAPEQHEKESKAKSYDEMTPYERVQLSKTAPKKFEELRLKSKKEIKYGTSTSF